MPKRKEHPAIERKLSELVRRHGLRHARYRGIAKVLRQALLTAMAVNLKRMLKLRTQVPDPERTRTVRRRVANDGVREAGNGVDAQPLRLLSTDVATDPDFQ